MSNQEAESIVRRMADTSEPWLSIDSIEMRALAVTLVRVLDMLGSTVTATGQEGEIVDTLVGKARRTGKPWPNDLEAV